MSSFGTPRRIRPASCIDIGIRVPPSKSYTNRALVAASLAEGASVIHNPSTSDDSTHLIAALRQFGVAIERGHDALEVAGTDGSLSVPSEPVFVGNAGTTIRFLASLAGLAPGETTLMGDERMNLRPINGLLDGLRMAGVRSSSANGFPPITVRGGTFHGGSIVVDAAVSSQFVSSILLSAPYAKRPVSLGVKGKLSSLPYVDMTLHVMRTFGGEVETIGYSNFLVDNTQRYIGQEMQVEADASAATYFFAAAAATGGRVAVSNLSSESLQGDVRFVSILDEMGCTVMKSDNGIEVRGGKLRGVEVDMNEMPDSVPTLAVLALFAEGTTVVHNVAHLRHKESDRLSVLATELRKLGAEVEVTHDLLIVHPRRLRGGTIETYNDHRIAMSFAVAGLRIPGIEISNPDCVTKSFPGFWEEFRKLEKQD